MIKRRHVWEADTLKWQLLGATVYVRSTDCDGTEYWEKCRDNEYHIQKVLTDQIHYMNRDKK